MLQRPRTPWLALLLGLTLLGATPFLGSADASPGASHSYAHSSQSARSRPRPGAARSQSQPQSQSRSHLRSDPEIAPDDPGLTREQILATSASESIGRAARGRLRNGVGLGENEVLDVIGSSAETAFGTSELVAMIESAAANVAERIPSSRLHVGDLSRQGGGHLKSHRSHRSGRDADISFYFVDDAGVPVPAEHFVRFDSEGNGVTGWSQTRVHFDTARNWALLESMMRFEGAELQYVFVAPRLQPLLLAEAARQGASQETIARAAALMSHYSRGHDNHFHVRIHCPAGDDECIDNEPPRRHRRGHASTARRRPNH